MRILPKLSRRIPRVGPFVAFLSSFLALVVLKIPTSFSNFWAEDGTFYQQALTEAFPRDIFSSGGGYIIFISRVIARIVTLGPISYAPFINEIVVTVVLSFFVFRLYSNLNFLIKSRVFKLIASISVFLLPINNFDVIASSGGLHFQLIFISLVIVLVARETGQISLIDLAIISIAILSDPLALISVTPLILRNRHDAIKFWKSKLSSLVFLGISALIQFIMVMKFHSQDSRTIGDTHSIIKTTYLFLDRVIGSTFIPHWGRVSSDNLLAGGISSQLIVRALIGITTFIVISLFTIVHLRKKLPIKEMHSKETISWLIVLPVLYWLTVGYLFNPEPRYAIFPGLSFLLISLILLDHLSCNERSALKINLLTLLVVVFSVLIWIFSASPSDRRIIGPEWHVQILKGELECNQLNQESVMVRILPVDDDWKVEISCDYLNH